MKKQRKMVLVSKAEAYKYLKADLMKQYDFNTIPVVYKITCVKNGMFYIGSTVNPEVRFQMHLLDLEYKKHSNYKMKLDFASFGKKNFTFEILESFDRNIERKMLYKKEQEWMDKLQPTYNINKSSEAHLKPKPKKSPAKKKGISPEPSQQKPKILKCTNDGEPEYRSMKACKKAEPENLNIKKIEKLQRIIKKASKSKRKNLLKAVKSYTKNKY